MYITLYTIKNSYFVLYEKVFNERVSTFQVYTNRSIILYLLFFSENSVMLSYFICQCMFEHSTLSYICVMERLHSVNIVYNFGLEVLTLRIVFGRHFVCTSKTLYLCLLIVHPKTSASWEFV